MWYFGGLVVAFLGGVVVTFIAAKKGWIKQAASAVGDVAKSVTDTAGKV